MTFKQSNSEQASLLEEDLPHDGTIQHGGCWCPPCRSAYMRGYWDKRDPGRARRREMRERCSRWSDDEDMLLGSAEDWKVAELLPGRSAHAVCIRRRRLGIEAYRPPNRCSKDGYVRVSLRRGDQFRDMASSNGYVMEHRLVMARHLGRPLTVDEIVHHRNGVKDDNRLENLELWTRAHPDGQRVHEIFEWCLDFVSRYAEEVDRV